MDGDTPTMDTVVTMDITIHGTPGDGDAVPVTTPHITPGVVVVITLAAEVATILLQELMRQILQVLTTKVEIRSLTIVERDREVVMQIIL